MDHRAPRVLYARERTAHPWRNGAGTASEVVIHPDGATVETFDWRVSVATVEMDSEFSNYPGIQRYLIPLSPGGLTLEVDGERRELEPFRPFEFAGESAVRAIDVMRSSLDLNLMVRRDFAVGSLETHEVQGGLNVVAARNESAVILLLGAGFGLAQLDAIELEPGSDYRLGGDGLIAIARVTAK